MCDVSYVKMDVRVPNLYVSWFMLKVSQFASCSSKFRVEQKNGLFSTICKVYAEFECADSARGFLADMRTLKV
jgi:hypothetical protein